MFPEQAELCPHNSLLVNVIPRLLELGKNKKPTHKKRVGDLQKDVVSLDENAFLCIDFGLKALLISLWSTFRMVAISASLINKKPMLVL